MIEFSTYVIDLGYNYITPVAYLRTFMNIHHLYFFVILWTNQSTFNLYVPPRRVTAQYFNTIIIATKHNSMHIIWLLGFKHLVLSDLEIIESMDIYNFIMKYCRGHLI